MSSSTSRSLSVALTASVLLVLTREAGAQESGALALNQFDPAPSGDDFFQVQSYRAGKGSFELSGQMLGEYARHPLTVYELENGAPGREVAEVVSDQLFLHLGASVGLFERLQLSLDFPFAVLNRGEDANAQGLTFRAPSGAAIGDLRAGVRLRLFGDEASPIGVAVGGYLFIPTGDDTEYTGNGNARGNPALILGGRLGPVLWGINSGVMIQEQATFGNTLLGTELTFGGGVALLMAQDTLQIGPELYGSTLLDKHGQENSLPPFDTKDTNLELLLGLKGRIEPIVLGAAAGPGLTKGIGTAQLRAMLSVAYAPRSQDRDHDGIMDEVDACPDVRGIASNDPAKNGCPPDRDQDGITDADDACPDVAGPPTDDAATNGCPDRDHDRIVDKDDACPDLAGPADPDPKKNGCPDRDHDGIFDDRDACPDIAGVANADPRKNGCPPDRDGDGVLDDVDACPDVPGVASTDPKRNGCPADTDGDGILDDVDACPTDAGKPNADPKKNGCPMAFLKGESIVISEQVQFRTDSDAILPASDELLTSVKQVFSTHPEMTRVLIEGHTDSVGGAAYNKALSDRRAASVRKWLLAHGVDGARLESKGYGFDRPIGDNATVEGRQTNRRVEFKVLTGAQQPPVKVQTSGTVPPKPAPLPLH